MSVEHGAVSSHVQALQGHHSALQEQSKRFLDAIEPLKGTWKGSSVHAWDEMTQAWNDSMEQVNQALNDLTGRVDTAGKTYQSGEEEQTSALQNRFAGMDMPSGNII
ncbi:WXG100 family type VII secretion target [Corynebacterium heidelbergense]|nr:WXG100 family type VII secretion target [Corynebacterium heidelbergense]